MIMNFFKLFIPPIFLLFLRKIKDEIIHSKKYRIGNFLIEIPPKFQLPHYQKRHKRYDRFLPVLVSQLTKSGLVIDVGANIGDTAVSIIQECENEIICFEPSNYFFSYLEKNITNLPNELSKRVQLKKELIGTGLIKGELDHKRSSTANLKIDSNLTNSNHKSLDNIICDTSNVILIKSDTDGFDFDVIKSGRRILAESRPILYWENDIYEDFQLQGYSELYTLLKELDYKYLFIFDNYGNLMLEEADFSILEKLNNYIYNQKKCGSEQPIYYVDVLASTEKDRNIVKKAVNRYLLQY